MDALINEIKSLDIANIKDISQMKPALEKIADAESSLEGLNQIFENCFADMEGVEGALGGASKEGEESKGGIIGWARSGIDAIKGAFSKDKGEAKKINEAMKNGEQWTSTLSAKRTEANNKFVSLFDEKINKYQGNIKKIMSGEKLDFSDIGSVQGAFDEMTKMLTTMKDEICPYIEMADTYSLGDFLSQNSAYKEMINTLSKDNNKGFTEYGNKYIAGFKEALQAQVTQTGAAIVDTESLEDLAGQVQKFIDDVGANTITKNLGLDTNPLKELIQTIKSTNQDSVDDNADALNDALDNGGGGNYSYTVSDDSGGMPPVQTDTDPVTMPQNSGNYTFTPAGDDKASGGGNIPEQVSIAQERGVKEAAKEVQDGVEQAQNDGEYSNDTSKLSRVGDNAREKAQQAIDDYLASIQIEGQSMGQLEATYNAVEQTKKSNMEDAAALGVDLSGFDSKLSSIRSAQQGIVDNYISSMKPSGQSFEQLEQMYTAQDEKHKEFEAITSQVNYSGFSGLASSIRSAQKAKVDEYLSGVQTEGLEFGELENLHKSVSGKLAEFKGVTEEISYDGFDGVFARIRGAQQDFVDKYLGTMQVEGKSFEDLEEMFTQQSQKYEEFSSVTSDLNYAGFTSLQGSIRNAQSAIVEEYLQGVSTEGSSVEELQNTYNEVKGQRDTYMGITDQISYAGFDTVLNNIQTNQQTIIDQYLDGIEPEGKDLAGLVQLQNEVDGKHQSYQQIAPDLNYTRFEEISQAIETEKLAKANDIIQEHTSAVESAQDMSSLVSARGGVEQSITEFQGYGLDTSELTALKETATGKMQDIFTQKSTEFTQRAEGLTNQEDRTALSEEITGFIATLPAGEFDTTALEELANSLLEPVEEEVDLEALQAEIDAMTAVFKERAEGLTDQELRNSLAGEIDEYLQSLPDIEGLDTSELEALKTELLTPIEQPEEPDIEAIQSEIDEMTEIFKGRAEGLTDQELRNSLAGEIDEYLQSLPDIEGLDTSELEALKESLLTPIKEEPDIEAIQAEIDEMTEIFKGRAEGLTDQELRNSLAGEIDEFIQGLPEVEGLDISELEALKTELLTPIEQPEEPGDDINLDEIQRQVDEMTEIFKGRAEGLVDQDLRNALAGEIDEYLQNIPEGVNVSELEELRANLLTPIQQPEGPEQPEEPGDDINLEEIQRQVDSAAQYFEERAEGLTDQGLRNALAGEIDEYLALVPEGVDTSRLEALKTELLTPIQQPEEDPIANLQAQVDRDTRAFLERAQNLTTLDQVNALSNEVLAYLSSLPEGVDASALVELSGNLIALSQSMNVQDNTDDLFKMQMQDQINRDTARFAQRAQDLTDQDDRNALANEINSYIAGLPAGYDTTALQQLANSLLEPVEEPKAENKAEEGKETEEGDKNDFEDEMGVGLIGDNHEVETEEEDGEDTGLIGDGTEGVEEGGGAGSEEGEDTTVSGTAGSLTDDEFAVGDGDNFFASGDTTEGDDTVSGTTGAEKPKETSKTKETNDEDSEIPDPGDVSGPTLSEKPINASDEAEAEAVEEAAEEEIEREPLDFDDDINISVEE